MGASFLEGRKELDYATKDDEGKPRTDLLPPLALIQVSRVMGFGAKKYADHNYISNGGLDHGRVCGALLRHIFQYMAGQDCDPETGAHHLAHAGCCVLMLLEMIMRGKGKDGRIDTMLREEKWPS